MLLSRYVTATHNVRDLYPSVVSLFHWPSSHQAEVKMNMLIPWTVKKEVDPVRRSVTSTEVLHYR